MKEKVPKAIVVEEVVKVVEKTASKSIFKSKQSLVAALTMISPTLFPTMSGWISEHPEWTLQIVGVVALILRMVTSKKVVLYEK